MAPPRRLPAPALLALVACRSADVASVNLDELMTAEHRFRYSAPIQTGFGYLLESVIDPSWFEEGSPLSGSDDEPIPNPTAVCLQNLLALRKPGIGLSGPFLQAEQVRQYARYAAYCPSALGRERAFLELAPHAARLGVVPVELEPGRAANAPELAEGLRGLREVLVRLAAARGRADETTQRDFAAACELLGRLELDLEGGRRLLRIIAAFGQLPGLDRRSLAPLLALSEDVQRRVTALALAGGRYDPHGAVRAAAFRAGYAAYGAPFLQEALLALLSPRFSEDGRVAVTERFRLLPERGEQEQPFLAVFDLVRRDGLPALPGTPAERMDRRLGQLHVLMQVTHDFSAYPERVRAAAMLTLGQVSGAGFESLREEDWGRWWGEHRVTETERIRRAEAAQAPTSADRAAGDGSRP